MDDKLTVLLDRGWLLMMADLGLDTNNVLRRARMPEDLLSRPNVRVTTDQYFRLWRGLEAEVGDPALPLRMAQLRATEAFHPALFAGLCSPNLSVAVRRIAQYKKLIAPMRVIIEERAEGMFVRMEWLDPSLEVPASLAATELVFLTQIARIGTRERIDPLRVISPYPLEPSAEYEAFFGVRPTEGAEHGVLFRSTDANCPFLTASDVLWATFEPDLQRKLSELESTAPVSSKVRSVLLESLPSGESTIEAVARRLGLTPRTLQRRLRPEGVSYKEILRKTREDLAWHYLKNTSLAHAEISFLVGFDEPSSFFRAFREWTGETPEGVRNSVLH